MAKPTNIYKTQVRVYFADTDAGGVVYHSRYIDFCERARAELLRQLGTSSSKIMQQFQSGFVVKHIDIDFQSAAKLDELITIETEIRHVGKSSVLFLHKLLPSQSTDSSNTNTTCIEKPFALVEILIVFVRMPEFKPIAMPKNLRQLLLS